MYSMDLDLRAKKPVIPSLLSAQVQLNEWVEANTQKSLLDADGVEWQLSMETREVPNHRRSSGLLWEVAVHLTAKLGQNELIETGVLKPTEDDRLLSMIGEEVITFVVKPKVFSADSMQAAKTKLSEVMPGLKKTFRTSHLNTIKRGLVERWIEDRAKFHSSFV